MEHYFLNTDLNYKMLYETAMEDQISSSCNLIIRWLFFAPFLSFIFNSAVYSFKVDEFLLFIHPSHSATFSFDLHLQKYHRY